MSQRQHDRCDEQGEKKMEYSQNEQRELYKIKSKGEEREYKKEGRGGTQGGTIGPQKDPLL